MQPAGNTKEETLQIPAQLVHPIRILPGCCVLQDANQVEQQNLT